MKKPLIVFIHGALHSSSCWKLVIDEIHSADPHLEVLAVDLPGHGSEPGDLKTLTIDGCVESVYAQIIKMKPDRLIIIGHSMAGIVIPGLTEKFGAGMVERIIFISCCIPSEGKSMTELLTFPISAVSAFLTRIKLAVLKPFPAPFSLWMFANGMNRQKKKIVLANLCPESMGFMMEPLYRKDFPKVSMDWVLLKRDHVIIEKMQRKCIANLGGVDNTFELNTCHNAMISEPERIAQIILERR